MEKGNAIELLLDLKSQIYKDNFHFEDWQKNTCHFIEKIFVLTFLEKQKNIKSISPVFLGNHYPKNEEQKQKNEEERVKFFKKAQERLANLIDDYIKEVNEFDIEINENEIIKSLEEQLKKASDSIELLKTEKEQLEKKIPKNIWDKMKQNATGIAIIGLVITVLCAAIPYSYNVGKDVGFSKYEKSKYDLEIRVDTLNKYSIKLVKHIQILENQNDSLTKMIKEEGKLKK